MAGSVICVTKCGYLSAEKAWLVLPSMMAWAVRGDWLWCGAHARKHECHHSFALSDWCDLLTTANAEGCLSSALGGQPCSP